MPAKSTAWAAVAVLIAILNPMGLLAQSKVRAVRVTKPEVADVDRTIELPADVRPFREVMVKARTSGYLESVKVDRGDLVTTGQILAIIDRPEDAPMQIVIERGYEVALKEVELAQAGVEAAESRIIAAGSGLEAAGAEVRAREIGLKLLAKNLARYRTLNAEGSATVQQLDESEAAVLEAEASLVTQKAKLIVIGAAEQEARALKSKASSGVKLAEAHAEAVKAKLDLFKKQLELKVIRAPFDAVVVKRMVHEGALALGGDRNSNPTVLFHLISSDALRVVIPIPESEVPFVRKGSKVRIRGTGIKGEPMVAVVTRKSALLDHRNRSLPVEVQSNDPRLIAGMGVYATITLETKSSVMTVPSEALSFRKKKAWLWAVVAGKAKKVNVKVGYNDLIRAEVLDLPADTRVIVNSAGLNDGVPVVETNAKGAGN